MAEFVQHIRKFKFCKSTEGPDQISEDSTLEVIIPEVVSPSYGMYTWPSAPVLAQYIWHNQQLFVGHTVLEIGAGTALPGIVAAKCGANVILSDSGQLQKCLQNCEISCKANGLAGLISIIGITWGLFTPQLLNLEHIDFILGSDCFYDPAVFEDILVTVSYILENNPNSKFICSYQERASDWTLDHLLNKWNLNYVSIPLNSFGGDTPNIAGSPLPGSHKIHVFQITHNLYK